MAKFLKSAFTNDQLFAGGTTTTPVYGMGARTYGGPQVRGREAHVQVREQNSGMMPAEDYRAAKFLPALWQDLERNGAPYTMQGGLVTGQAGLTDGTDTICLTHQVMPANAGVAQKLLYTNLDIGLTVNASEGGGGGIDLSAGKYAPNATTDRVTAAGASSLSVAGNKPLAYTPTNVIGTAWNDIYTNQQFDQPVTMKTQWLVMYPVDDVFMYGGTIDASSGAVTVNAASVGMSRSVLGFADVTIDNVANGSIALGGLQHGDRVMPNPYLPGKLISVEDFVRLAIFDDGGNISGAGGMNAVLDAYVDSLLSAAVDYSTATTFEKIAIARAYAEEHIVGIVFQRQARATYSGGAFINKDISTEIMTFLAQVPELNLQGTQSEGFEADQERARQFAKSGLATTADVVFINFNIK